MRVSPGVSGNAVTPFLVVRRSTRYATMRETMEDRLQSVQMSARSAAERARAASQVAGRMPDYQQSITPGTRADDLPPHDEPPPASLRPPPAPIKMLRVLPEPIIVPPTAPSACVAVVSPASSHPASSHRGSQPTEGDSHWKWAFKALEQRNRELVLQTEFLQAENDALHAKMAQMTGTLGPAGRTNGHTAIPPTIKRSASSPPFHRGPGLPSLHAGGRSPTDMPPRSVSLIIPPSMAPPTGRSPAWAREPLSSRLNDLRSPMSSRSTASVQPSSSRLSTASGQQGYAQGYEQQGYAQMHAQQGYAQGPPGYAQGPPGYAQGPPGYGPPQAYGPPQGYSSGYASREPNRQNFVGRPDAAWLYSSPRRSSGYGQQQGVMGSPRPSPKSVVPSLKPKMSKSPSRDGLKTPRDAKRLDRVAFREEAKKLEPTKDWTDDALRKRFKELGPKDGQVYLEDYRLTLLFETLSKKCAKVIDLFRSWDKDDSKTVDKKEFRTALQSIGFNYTAAEIDVVFSHLDGDESGLIDYSELNLKLRPSTCARQAHKLRSRRQLKRGGSKKIALQGKKKLLSGPGAPTVAEQLKEIIRVNYLKVMDVFQTWDVDESGSVDKKEFAEVLESLGYDATTEEYEDVFDGFDLDRSGSLDYKELSRKLRQTVARTAEKPRQSSRTPPAEEGTDDDIMRALEADLAKPEGADLAEPEGTDLAEPEGADPAEPEAVDLGEPEAVDLAEPDAVDVAEPEAVDVAEPEAGDVAEPNGAVAARAALAAPPRASRPPG